MEELLRLKARIEKKAYALEAGSKADRNMAEWLRSLLDSGEEQECPDCEGEGSIEYTNGPLARCGRCSGSGRATRTGEERECPDWSDAEIRAAVAAFRATEERS